MISKNCIKIFKFINKKEKKKINKFSLRNIKKTWKGLTFENLKQKFSFESLKKTLDGWLSKNRELELASGPIKSALFKKTIDPSTGFFLLALMNIVDRFNESNDSNNSALAEIFRLSDKEVFERIKKIVTSYRGITENSITLTTSFYEDLDADSLDIIELTLRFEESFKIDMAEEDSLKLKTIADMFAYIKTKIETKRLQHASVQRVISFFLKLFFRQE